MGWYGFNKGDTVRRDGPVCGGELDSQVDNRGHRELCLVWGHLVALTTKEVKKGSGMADRE